MEDFEKYEYEDIQLTEAEKYRAAAEVHKDKLKNFWSTFLLTGVLAISIIAIAGAALSWFVSNNRVGGLTPAISATGQMDFELATVGEKEQGVYDSVFGLSSDLVEEEIGGETFYISSGNSSFRLDSDKNFNNYLANADLRPGNRGNFDLYIICRTNKSEVALQPIFSAWYEKNDTDNIYLDAFKEESTDRRVTAEYLKGHILLFSNMDDKGMYSGNIDFAKKIRINLTNCKASQGDVTDDSSWFEWGGFVYSDENTKVYRLPVYWVWPEQFGNFIYTGNSYNKNLFAQKNGDYRTFYAAMNSESEYKKFFCVPGGVKRPNLDTIFDSNDFQTATKNYDLYSEWYNTADEKIGTMISYIELGFEIVEDSP